MSKRVLKEAAGSATKTATGRWRAVLAKPGQGSSGFYSEDVLKEYGPKALGKGAKAFINHEDSRNPKDMIGTYPDGAVYEEGVGLVGELEVFSHWREFVEEVGPHCGLSIYMLGESDEDGNVTSLVPDRMNGVDLVSYPGLEGSGLAEQLYESARAQSAKERTAASAVEKEKKSMDELQKAIEALTTLMTTFVTEQKAASDAATKAEAAAKAEVEDKDKAVATALESYDTAVKAIADVKTLAPSQVESLTAKAKKGEDITEALAEAKKIADEFHKITESDGDRAFGRVTEAAHKRDEDWTVAELGA